MSKTYDSFVNWTAENCPISSLVRLLIQKLFWTLDEGFNKASWVVPQTWYLHGFQIWSY